MEKFLTYSHIFCGLTVLVLGIFNFINRKGGNSHVIIGKIYAGAMFWICASAFLVISFYRFSGFLMVIGVLTFYATFVGIRVLKRKKPGSEKWYDWLASILTILFGLGLFVYGAWIWISRGSFHPFMGLYLFFGLFTAYGAFQDIQFFFNKHIAERQWWLKQHISAIGGSYIAAITAAAVQNGNHFMPDSQFSWLLWVLPTAIGSPLISMAVKRHLKPKLT